MNTQIKPYSLTNPLYLYNNRKNNRITGLKITLLYLPKDFNVRKVVVYQGLSRALASVMKIQTLWKDSDQTVMRQHVS